MSDPARVLHVDDDPAFLDLVATFLEREDDGLTVVTATDAEAALERVRAGDVDCVVSDYDMPGTDGLDLLAEIRADAPDLPFILFTGKGSEEIAAEAISQGVTDYLQKRAGTDQYRVLANRVRNAIERRRATAEAERTRRFLEKLLARTTEMIAVVGADREIEFLSGSVEEILGYSPAEIRDRGLFGVIHPDDRASVAAQFETRLDDPDHPTGISFRARHADGRTVDCHARAYNLLADPDVGGIVVYARPAGASPDA